jgi:hypothetical protein
VEAIERVSQGGAIPCNFLGGVPVGFKSSVSVPLTTMIWIVRLSAECPGIAGDAAGWSLGVDDRGAQQKTGQYWKLPIHLNLHD